MSISISQQVSEFKTTALTRMKEKQKDHVIMELADLARYFGFEPNPHAWTWLPKRFRTELVKQKVRVYKARGKDYVTITIKE